MAWASRAPEPRFRSAPSPSTSLRRAAMCPRGRSRGLSLLEVVVFVVVLAVGFAGVLILYNQATRASVDPLIRKQALAIAQSLLEEIELHPYTYCDPDDANVYTASSTAGCATMPENNFAPEGE